MTETTTGQSALACYVYGITTVSGKMPLGRLRARGVDPTRPLFAVACVEVCAVASEVSLDEFGEDAFNANLNDPAWIAGKARAHEFVLDALLAARTVVPMRFGTVCLGKPRVREMLECYHEQFARMLSRLDGKQEWGVKVFCDLELARRRIGESSDAAASLRAQMAGKSEGALFFLKKKLEDALATEMERAIDRAVADGHEMLSALARDSVVLTPWGREITGDDRDMVLNAAYLVQTDGLEAFRSEIGRLNRENAALGFAFETTGPWPPYNFARVEDEEGPADG